MTVTISKSAIFAASLSLATFTGCGGGSSTAPTPTPTPTPTPVAPATFPLQQALTKLYSNGFQQTVSMSGTASESGNAYALTGSAKVTVSPATVSTTFNGQAALQGSSSVTGTLVADSQTINYASANQVYATSNYSVLGNSSPTSYCVASTPTQAPATVTLGQNGSYVTYACYSDSTMATSIGTETITYLVSTGTSSTTATVSMLDVVANSVTQQSSATETNYLIDASGNITFLSVNVFVIGNTSGAYYAASGSNLAASGTEPPTPTPTAGFFVSQAQFEQMFPNRLPFYTYAGIVASLAAYPTFGNTGNDTVNKQEVAAFLANVYHETIGLEYIDEINQSNPSFPGYCYPDASYPCTTGQQYFGRGPLGISWNFNYGPAGQALGLDLLDNPNLVTTDSTVAWDTAIWFWMTQADSNNYTGHTAMTDSIGFGEAINAINGGVECGATGLGYQEMQDRSLLYQQFAQLLGVAPGNKLTC